ncbi:MAG: PEP-CTERM sorting domain-containing protein [Desulfarculaceae bacterium]|nr:PEP-CTERM sorting domain-containing protein [Desulfarculaceae bacterium]MCF8072291.1 PEP-CTERM sorting domain-containing protein [Desulfarculaceae bacterium]MCF8100212.1 PEP-CTERM sorting domain-containing protein [Desulfarculaceae bacterium]MCF8116215.1 PEP-CTERM sorting domain-containing protein [Desulfarculaceae bacterium]
MLLALLVVALPAQADIIQTQTFGPQVPDYFPALTFNQYNGNLSDITGIVVELSLTSVGGLAQVDNESASIANVTVEFGTSGWLISGGPALPSVLTNPAVPATTVTSGSYSLGVDDGDGAGVQSGGADYAELLGTNITNTLSGSVGSGNWADYVGAGTFNITGVINTYLSITGASGISQGSTPPTVNGFVQVTYQTNTGGTGSSTPEPASLLLLTSGLGGLAAWRVRRKRKDQKTN